MIFAGRFHILLRLQDFICYQYYKLQMMAQKIPQPQKLSKVFLLKMSDPAFYKQQLPNDVWKQIFQAKMRDRPQLDPKQWDKHSYYRANVIQKLKNCHDTIDRVTLQSLSYERFAELCIKKKEPVIITGCTEKWANSDFWSHNHLASVFTHHKFKVGEDDDGKKIKLPFHTFMQYLIRNTDDSPLYLFENITVQNKENRIILQNYSVPSLFAQNLLQLLEPEDRPAFKWFLVGPERSGSGIHIDPILTCAWNTSLVGRKRWVLFDGKIAQNIVTGKEFKIQNQTDEAIDYFLHILPQIKQKYNTEQLGLREFIQNPGETVFVPGGAWHAVLNLQDTVAVTQNFVSSVNLQESWPSFMEQRGELVIKMLKQLKTHNEQLYEKVASLSKQSHQWRQTFGKKLQAMPSVQQRTALIRENEEKQVTKKKRKSLSFFKISKHSLKSKTSKSVKKKGQVFQDQQWFQ